MTGEKVYVLTAKGKEFAAENNVEVINHEI